MENELAFDYRIDISSPGDKHFVRAMNELLGSIPNPVEIKCDHADSPYSSHLRMRASGQIGLMEHRIDTPAHSSNIIISERSRSHISRNQFFEFNVSVWMGGENSMKVGGHKHSMRSGDVIVAGNDTPLYVQARGPLQVYNLALPASWERIGDTRLEHVFGHLFAARIRRNNGLAAYVKQLLSRPNALALPGASEKLYDAIALALNPRATSEHKAGLLAMICNYIDTHYADPNLNPASVAAAFNITGRYLYLLFAASNASFAEYLVEQRLSQARRILTGPRYQKKTILTIAQDCGFRDINHFGRRFRKRYGCTPGELRLASSGK